MVANYKRYPLTLQYLRNDDVETCQRLIGKKMVPILEDSDQITVESLDIARLLDERGDNKKFIRQTNDYPSTSRQLKSRELPINGLLFPRSIQIGLPEFTQESSQRFFQANKEPLIGMSFDQAIEQTESFKTAVEEALDGCEDLALPSNNNDTISWADVIIFPTLRNLTMVKNIQMPDLVENYLYEVSALTNVNLYNALAI